MKNDLPLLRVNMLGGFSAIYGETPISSGRNTATRSMKLLKLLIYYGENGISREDIFKELFRYEEIADMANNLRVTVHRIKKLIADVGLPEGEYITVKQGIYYWNPPMEMEIDARVFESLLKKADQTEDEHEKIELLEKACSMYKGDFLNNITGEEWVLHEGVHYKMLYTEALKQLCGILMKNGDFETALEYSSAASDMYPFDEWQAVKIDCLMSMNRYKDAMREYESTAKLFFEELGISPSEKMLEQFKQMSKKMDYKPQAIREIKNRLREESNEEGAFYCTLPSFRDTYQLMSRVIERNGQSAYLMMCCLTNKKGQPLEKDSQLKEMGAELDHAISVSLRRGDCYTRCSQSQFLILLVGTNKEACGRIFERIRNKFSENHKTWAQNLEYYASFLTEVEKEDSPIRFNDQKLW